MGLTALGQWAFYGCSSLRQLSIPAGVGCIGALMLSFCSGLEELVIPAGLTNVDPEAFHGVLLTKRWVLTGGLLAEKLFVALSGHVADDARVVGAELAGRKFGKFTIFAE